MSTCGDKAMGSCNIPPLDEGVTYTQPSAGLCHTVLLRSDGSAVGCGRNDFGQHDIPPLDEQMSYTQVSAGRMHRVLLRNDGRVACGSNEYGESNIPPLDEGMSYTQISAGADHTVLLRSDGSVVACERNDYGQCDIPPIVDEGTSYTQVLAGNGRTFYIGDEMWPVLPGRNIVLQLDSVRENDAVMLRCSNLAGQMLHFNVSDLASLGKSDFTDCAWAEDQPMINLQNLQVVWWRAVDQSRANPPQLQIYFRANLFDSPAVLSIGRDVIHNLQMLPFKCYPLVI